MEMLGGGGRVAWGGRGWPRATKGGRGCHKVAKGGRGWHHAGATSKVYNPFEGLMPKRGL